MGGVLGAGSAIGARMVLRQPLYARIHAFALQVTAGYWMGYQWNKWCSKKNMSEYKHAVDFAQRHSVSKSDSDQRMALRRKRSLNCKWQNKIGFQISL